MSKRVEGKVALVTGAGSGIGKDTSLLLAKEGASVVVTDINEETAKETAREIEENGGTALALEHDVTSEKAWQEVVEATISKFGTIDILFNNAGIYIIRSLVKTTLEEWKHLMDVNVNGVFLGMKAVAPVMAESGGGSIINISSSAALQGSSGHTLYGASKGAVQVMTKAVAAEYGVANVRVNSLMPGYIHTGMAEYGAEVAKTTPEALGEKLYPLGRIGETEDVAQAVLYLASEDSSFMTGSDIVLDGGAHAVMSFKRKKKK